MISIYLTAAIIVIITARNTKNINNAINAISAIIKNLCLCDSLFICGYFYYNINNISNTYNIKFSESML